ncbi:porin family protein [Pararhodonellum marinum]|uniref:hypothetical protein n=1 Tax=Pararhodonellum marinum TaxID=2755358 RepID=UPI001E58EB82|nr:hypothetical protein [Pararhodonellum marinum]
MKSTIFIILFMFFGQAVFAQWSLDLETGLGFPGYNEVRIPNQGGTNFDFNRDFEARGAVVPLRIRPGYTFGKNHVFGLFAPLGIYYEGNAPFPIQFQQTQFEEGAEIAGFYKFNSYRLTYRRDLVLTDRWTLGLGFTAKIRDATVRLTSGDQTDRKDDVGFVPLVHIFAAYHMNGWSAFVEGDGLAGGPGRAFDFLIGAKAPISEKVSIKAGYRILEGGANVDEVYNFTLINFASVGLIWVLGDRK